MSSARQVRILSTVRLRFPGEGSSALAGLLETETGQEGEQDAPTSGEEQA